MTLFGAGLVTGGVSLLGYACVAVRSGRRIRPPEGEARPARDWSDIDRSRPEPPTVVTPLPRIQRSALLDETEPIVTSAPPWNGPGLPAPSFHLDDTVAMNRIGTGGIDRDDTVPISYARPVSARFD
jgi:hypothetical protein